ncbi:MAG: ATP-binding cassette domain-containing protein [Terriglobales bacterium]
MALPAIEVESLAKLYLRLGHAPVRALDAVSFTVPRGAIFGLLGPNGAGKTTLLKILTTLLRPSSGQARVAGHDCVAAPLAVRQQITMVLQETAAELFLGVRDNLLSYARFHGLGAQAARRRAEQVLEIFQIADRAEDKVQDLSGGTRRRVQVAKVFMVATPVVFLDEFSTGMDPILKRAIMGLLRAEAAHGRTIVLTTQILSEAEELCDDILILHHGREVARGDLHALKQLSAGLYEVSVLFEQLPPSLEANLAALQPLRAQVEGNAVELALRLQNADVLPAVNRLAQGGRVLHLEVRGASLEDIFVQLTQGERP